MTAKFAKKLYSAYHKLEALKKDKENPFYKSNYTDINGLIKAIKPVLKSEGLFTLQPIIDNEVVTYIVDAESGEVFPELGSAGIKLQSIKPQERGSEVTFYRRYGLQSLLTLEAEDDDANATVGKKRINQPIKNSFEL